MTATAEFPATYVRDRADERIADMEKRIAETTETVIASAMQNHVTTGAMWWKRNHYRTRAEAEDWANAPNGFRGSVLYWSTHDEKYTIEKLIPLRRISAAAIQAGVKTVTLGASDCFILGIPLEVAA